MTFEESQAKAKELNASGVHRDKWHYYTTYNDDPHHGGFFVMRRKKYAELHVAVFCSGIMSSNEK